MRKTFLLTSILLLSAAWALAQYSSGSNATDQNSTGSQSSGASSGSSSGSQNTMDQNAPADQSEPQSSGGSTRSQTSSGASEDQGTTGQSMSSQQGETSSDMSGMHKGGTTSRTMTFEGCLSESNGKFELTDKMGTRYELTGKTANLKAHVGHTIAVTGKASTSGENQPGAMSGEQGGMEQTLNVSSFRHVSSKCKSSTGSSTGGSNY